jgi:hypothetical protein
LVLGLAGGGRAFCAGTSVNSASIASGLASVALEDEFAEAFTEARGKVDRSLKLGF